MRSPACGPQRGKADSDLFDATFDASDANPISDSKRSLDQDVDAVNEAAANVLQREADAEGGGAEDRRDGGPVGSENGKDHGGTGGEDGQRGGTACQRGDFGVSASRPRGVEDRPAEPLRDPDRDQDDNKDLEGLG